MGSNPPPGVGRWGRTRPVKHIRWDLREDGPLVFKPGSFAIGSTLASVQTCPTLLVFLDTRSGIARYGVQNHLASQVINGTWKNPVRIVLEVVNLGPMEIVLSEGMPIGMIYFGQLTRAPSERRQGTTFRAQNGPVFAGPQEDPTPRSPTGIRLARIRRALADWIAP
jgi:deoxycytidine triphosphate deaminase